MEELLRNFLGGKCYTEMITNGNFESTCIKLLISKFLGILIITGSLILKVPQILKIVNAKSARGIALPTLLLELAIMLFTMSFGFRQGFPFGTYGETAFVSIQNLVIFFLVYVYGTGDKNQPTGVTPSFFAIMAIYGAAVYAFLMNPANLIPFEVIVTLQAMNIPILIASRVPQIWANYKAGSTGQLALATWVLTFVGALARVFTTLQEAFNPVLLVGYVIGASMSGTICLQIILYGSEKPKAH